MRPAQVRYVDDVTFTITLYSPKPTLLQAICIDNKWMFCPKEWYKDIMVNDANAPHWSGETDLKLIGGEGLPTITEEEALANALKKSPLYNFENFSKLGDQRIIDILIDGLNPETTSFVLDTHWLQKGGVNIIEWLKKLEGRCDILHLKDYAVAPGENNGYITECGSGNINFEEVIKQIAASASK